MGVGYNPRIVTDQMILCLDAANAKSITGTGQSWIDLSRNGYAAIPANGPTYSSTNGGIITFDGTDDEYTTGLNTFGPNTSWEAWFRLTSNKSGYNMFMGRYLPYFGQLSGNRIIFSNNIGGAQQTVYSNTTLSISNWYHVICTTAFDTTNTTAMIYVNGSVNMDSTYNNVFSGQQVNYPGYYFTIGDGYNHPTSWYPFNGDVAIVRIYNKTLSLAEVRQNFNANRKRFGI